MIGIVVVSHSRDLAEAAVELATQMVPDRGPSMRVAAGVADGLGTDATAVADAIRAVDSADGVLVLMDLGSAVLSAQLALELLSPEMAGRVRLTGAPLVEGLVAAVVTAASGAGLSAVATEAAQGLAGKLSQLGEIAEVAPPAPAMLVGQTTTITITNPHGLHARPAAALVAGLAQFAADVELTSPAGKQSSARSVTGLATLGLLRGDQARVVATGPDAEAALTAVRRLAEAAFGELPEVPAKAPSAGAGTGRQVAVAPARVISGTVDLSGYRSGTSDTEQRRLEQARADVRQHLQGIDAGNSQAFSIAAAQLALLSDDGAAAAEAAAIAGGCSATEAVLRVWAGLADRFDELVDAYQRERAQDVRSLRRMLLSALSGQPLEVAVDEPSVLVVDELDLITASRLDPATTMGVVTMQGSTTGHGALVARARGIALLAGHPEAGQIRDGDLLAIDPVTDELLVNPSQQQLDQLRARAARRAEEIVQAEAHAHEPALTKSGREIVVAVNVGSVADARMGARSGAQGSGLVRTEVLFADRVELPGAEEQAGVLLALADALGHGELTVRLWDAGADKPLRFLPMAHETNPQLGLRGVRALRRHPEAMNATLTACCLAARQSPIRVMVPMVTEPEEMVWVASQLDAVVKRVGGRRLPLGMMVEVPAAAIRAADFVGLVDFASIGTNDLTQYTQAADRQNSAVASLGRPGRPAVLDLIAATCEGLAGTPVAVCGDLASDPAMTEALVSRGVVELSVRPPLVGTIKQAVRQVDTRQPVSG